MGQSNTPFLRVTSPGWLILNQVPWDHLFWGGGFFHPCGHCFSPGKLVRLHVRIFGWLKKYRERTERKTWIHVCLFASNALCVCVCVGFCVSVFPSIWVFVRLHAHAWIAYLPRFGWLQQLFSGTRPDCPSANTTKPKCELSTSWYTQIHTNTTLQGTMFAGLCQCSPKSCWHIQCLYTHGAFFHRPSYQFNQEMEHSGAFVQQCLRLINDSFGEKCDQGHVRSIYFKQSLTHPAALLNTCSPLISSPVNSASTSTSNYHPACSYIFSEQSASRELCVSFIFPFIHQWSIFNWPPELHHHF